MVEGNVWHAVVRGYYYAEKSGDCISKMKFYQQYFEQRRSV